VPRLERVEHLDDRMPVLRQTLLGHLHVHLGPMLLQAQVRVLFEPPRRDLTLADTAKDGRRRRVLRRVVKARLGEHVEVACEDLGTGSQGVDDYWRQVNLDLAWRNPLPNHPHGVAFRAGRPAVNHDALGLQVDNNGLRRPLGFLEHLQGQELGQRAQLDGETDELAPAVILGHALDDF